MEYNELERIRVEKVEQLRAQGINPYPTRAHITHTAAEAIAAFEAAEAAGSSEPIPVCVGGRLRSTRAMGKLMVNAGAHAPVGTPDALKNYHFVRELDTQKSAAKHQAGFVEVMPERTTLLVESFEPVEDKPGR